MSSVVDTMIPAAMFGAEVSGVRSVIVMHGPYMIPRPDIPPLGTGLDARQGAAGPAAGPVGGGGHDRGLPQLRCRPSTGPAPRWGCRRCRTCPA